MPLPRTGTLLPMTAPPDVPLTDKERELLKKIAVATRPVRGSELILAGGPEEVEDSVKALLHLVDLNHVRAEGEVSSSAKTLLNTRFSVPAGHFTEAMKQF